jgi:hypothetical protein
MRAPGTLPMLQNTITPEMYTLFDDILSPTDAEIQRLSEIDPGNLGDPARLFSYEALRSICTLYSTDEAVTFSLRAKLDAAELAEASGNLAAKRAQLKLFQNQVSFQSGKALTVNQARTLRANGRVFESN